MCNVHEEPKGTILKSVNSHVIIAAGLQVATRKETGDRLVRAAEDTGKQSDKKSLPMGLLKRFLMLMSRL